MAARRPSKREQAQLDELLSDIFRGIENLPDSGGSNSGHQHRQQVKHNIKPYKVFEHETQVKEYEVDSSSPLVAQHRRDIAQLRRQEADPNYQSPAPAHSQTGPKPHRSTLKRQPHASHEDPARQLSATPEPATNQNQTGTGRRRVRIVEHPEHQQRSSSDKQAGSPKPKIKYLNTNKFIYHQEKNPDDQDDPYYRDYSQDSNSYATSTDQRNDNNHIQDDDDFDGVTKVEYYHTSWLDRQLGRASKRRSSKELNERQVKEKAMIEELKRSLKSGVITLKQSVKGKKHHNNKHQETSLDDLCQPHSYQQQQANNRTNHKDAITSGLATLPRNSNRANPSRQLDNQQVKQQTVNYPYDSNYQPARDDDYYYDYNQNFNYNPTASESSKTLPKSNSQYLTGNANTNNNNSSYATHNSEPHQLLESHYRSKSLKHNWNSQNSNLNSNINTNTNINSHQTHHQAQSYASTQPQRLHHQATSDPMRDPNSSYQRELLEQQHPSGTISSLPSATEVVRSALSRSSSQQSLNQLNKTINLLPQSPPPYQSSGHNTPIERLHSGSPSPCPTPAEPQVLRGTRVIPPKQPQPQHQQQPQQSSYHQPSQYANNSRQTTTTTTTTTTSSAPCNYPGQHQQQVYANPHASLMQHRLEQQAKQPNKNVNSIREFNELDSLLRSLGPSGGAKQAPSSAQLTPGYSSRPAQATLGGYHSSRPQPTSNNTDLYSTVNRQKQPQSQIQSQQHQYQPQQKQHQPPRNTGFTIDATESKDAECLANQRANLSSFEPPIQLLPTMEDYQNISKLNPVKNHYWYKPTMSRERAIGLLKNKPQGTFIVRDSTSFKGAYGLAVKVSKLPKNVLNNASLRDPRGDPEAELIRHFLIEPTTNGVRLKGYANEPVFDSLPNLIYQHSLTELALPCKLLIPRADIEDTQFNEKQRQYYDEFVASREQAKHPPYEDTAPDGGYRKYPGNVLIHNEHRIIFQ